MQSKELNHLIHIKENVRLLATQHTKADQESLKHIPNAKYK
jgi:hypothetical protein